MLFLKPIKSKLEIRICGFRVNLWRRISRYILDTKYCKESIKIILDKIWLSQVNENARSCKQERKGYKRSHLNVVEHTSTQKTITVLLYFDSNFQGYWLPNSVIISKYQKLFLQHRNTKYRGMLLPMNLKHQTLIIFFLAIVTANECSTILTEFPVWYSSFFPISSSIKMFLLISGNRFFPTLIVQKTWKGISQEISNIWNMKCRHGPTFKEKCIY